MPLFQRPPLDTLTPAKDRWTPIYLEHGRIEVDDAAIKWIDSKGKACPIPVATVSALILGPGTTITHAAVKAVAQCNCPLLWLGEDGLRFYAYGITPNNWNMADNINRALSAATASHYALIAAVCCSMGFIPQLGFVHKAGTLPFIYDAADLYKHETSWPAAFEAISIDPKDDGTLVRKILKRNVEQSRMLKRAPNELKALFRDLSTLQEPKPHPLQPKSEV